LAISPFGKVPVLKVEETVLFESAVINEYLDEINPPSMHPADPLKKAFNRAWIEFGSSLNMDMFRWAMTDNQDEHDQNFKAMITNLERLEAVLDETGPFFNGPEFSLVDAANAPFFMRLAFIAHATGTHYLEKLPKISKWHLAMKAKKSVQGSVIPNIKDKFLGYINQKEGSVLSKSF
jgi:glutathione S-transferase